MANEDILDNFANKVHLESSEDAVKTLTSGLLKDLRVGDLLRVNYETAEVLIHDYARQQVRGLPHGSFLLATRMALGEQEIQVDDEYASLILLRIIGDCALPHAAQMDEYRLEAGKRAAGSEEPWDHEKTLDAWTRNNMSFGGYKCRVLGTFRMRKDDTGNYVMVFGADLLNFYSGQGMKVYKPIDSLLSKIVNYQKSVPQPSSETSTPVRIGRLRYASSEIGIDERKDNVEIRINPNDFVSRRTFYGGMSRGGKSNAMKMTATAIYLLRKENKHQRIGQLIFDPNGEYANINPQDKGSIRNVYKLINANKEKEIATYGLNRRSDDPDRKIVKINFYGEPISSWRSANKEQIDNALGQLYVGKGIIDTKLQDASSQYVNSFRDTIIEAPESFDDGYGEKVRFIRLITIYQGILFEAGFKPPTQNVKIEGLFGGELCEALKSNSVEGGEKSQIAAAGESLEKKELSWSEFTSACKGLEIFMSKGSGSEYDSFENNYRSKKKKPWADEKVRSILQIYSRQNGVRQFQRVARQHDPQSKKDFAAEIVKDLEGGKLVIFDQSTGDPDENLKSAERILWKIFDKQKDKFINPEMDEKGEIRPIPPIMVYLEEAHNLLPAAGGKDDLKSIWARTAKEGSKYQIGMVLATQEPSSVMPAILKNTDNWFVAHLNNSDEVQVLSKFYDFEDYAHQIKTITDPGFVRMRTLSNPFTIPVQIDLFKAPPGE